MSINDVTENLALNGDEWMGRTCISQRQTNGKGFYECGDDDPLVLPMQVSVHHLPWKFWLFF